MKKFIKLPGLGLFVLASIFHSCKKEELPTLSTSSITNITATTGSGGGNITSDGGVSITARGVCWSSNSNPSITDSKTNDGTGDGQYVSSLIGLSAGSTYHVRAYATNSVGTAYGADLSFATLGKAPECLTQVASNISSSGAILNGTVNANYLSTTVTFEYGTTSTYGQTIAATQSPVTGNSLTNVTAELTGLVAGTTYHFRIKTENSLGTTSGNDLTFITAGQVPTAITHAACCFSSTGAKLNGTVNANYLSTTVTFDYGLTTAYGNTVTAIPSPVIGNTSTNVSASISGLIGGTTYHFRIKALNELGTTFGEDLTFTTNPVVPTLTTTAVTDKTYTSAVSGGNVSTDGGSIVTSRGICWSTIPNPTINEEHTTDGTGTGSFTSNMKCLSFATTYYVRAYATNSVGTAYGAEQSFTTLGTNPIIFNPNLTYGSVSDIDGNCYKTIQIGTQTWMAENLKVTHYRDGTSCEVTWYNNDLSTNKDTYGALYNWIPVFSDKVCPMGWHVPSSSEWTTLTTFLGGEIIAGGKLKETGTYHWTSPNTDANNETGFTALPGGKTYIDGSYDAGNYGYWWSRTPCCSGVVPYYASKQTLTYDQSTFYKSRELKSYEISIRCIKDVGPNLTTDPASNIISTSDVSGYTITLTSGGHDINDNGSAITHKGICWNYEGNPEISDLSTDEGGGVANFKSTITFRGDVLLHGIHIRAYATNGNGTGYGDEIVLSLGDLIN